LRRLPNHPPIIQGGWEYEGAPNKYKNFEKLWKKIFKSTWKPSEENGVAINAYGNPVKTPYSFYYWRMCHNNPRWHKFQKQTILQRAKDQNIAVIRQDNIGVPVGITKNGGFCKFCQKKFRKFLLSKYSLGKLKQMGINNPENFNIRKYVLEKNYIGKPDKAINDPIICNYLYFLYYSNLSAWLDIVNAVKKIAPNKPIGGNQGPAGLNPYSSIIVSQRNDYLFYEHNLPWLYPYLNNSVRFKLAQAAGKYKKPILIWDFRPKSKMNDSEGAKIFLAECYANGVIPYYVLNNFGGGGPQNILIVSSPVYNIMKKYANFAHKYHNLLTNVHKTYAKVALVYSIPSFMYKHSGALRFPINRDLYRKQWLHFEGFARVLENMHIPYEVIIFGGPKDLWDDKEALKSLNNYALIILPNVEAMTKEQAKALHNYLKNGGHIIFSGKLGIRDEYFKSLTNPYFNQSLPKYTLISIEKGKTYKLGNEPVEIVPDIYKLITGAYQEIILNQKEPKTLILSGWSKASNVKDANYCLYVDAQYMDGTWHFMGLVPFSPGMHDWEYAKLEIKPAKPLKKIKIYLLFRYTLGGKVWFDDIILREKGSNKNILINPSFESNNSWLPYGSGFEWDNKYTHSGKRSICCFIKPPILNQESYLKITQALKEAIPDTAKLIETNAPSSVYINPLIKNNNLIIHLLNYGKDEVKNIKLKIKWKDRLVKSIWLISPDLGPRKIPVHYTNGIIEITIPQLKVWDILCFSL